MHIAIVPSFLLRGTAMLFEYTSVYLWILLSMGICYFLYFLLIKISAAVKIVVYIHYIFNFSR